MRVVLRGAGALALAAVIFAVIVAAVGAAGPRVAVSGSGLAAVQVHPAPDPHP